MRERRLECGLTQAELATRAGVSRQLVAAVEAGRNTPAVDAALRLASALGTSVEELFSSGTVPVVSALGGALPDRAAVRVGRVGEQLVVAELPDHGVAGSTWGKPDGSTTGGALELFGGAIPAGLVVAGCDPALGVAEAMLGGLGPRSMLAIAATTQSALDALADGRIHAAVVHGPPDRLPRPPVRVERLHLARWQVGLAVAPTRRARSLDALLQGSVPIVQRDAGAASQQALERALTRAGLSTAPAAARLASGHLEAARAASMLKCAAVTTESAALAFGLAFHGLEQHAVEIWLAGRWIDHPAASAFGELLAGAGFVQRVAQFGGYDLTGCGARL